MDDIAPAWLAPSRKARQSPQSELAALASSAGALLFRTGARRWADVAANRRNRGNLAGAFEITARAAKSGDVAAQSAVADMYLKGAGVPRSFAAARLWFERSALSGNASSMVKLAKLNLAGQGLETALFERPTKPDRSTALRWAKAAATAGLPEGKSLLAALLADGDRTNAVDQQTALTLIDEAAAEGDPSACLQLALRSRRGDKGDPEAIALLLRRAAEGGLPMAIYLLGIATEIGFGLRPDGPAAVRLYRTAAEAGSRPAQVRLACALLAGSYLKPSLVQAESWLRKASAAGDGRAMALIGDLRAGRDGLPASYEESASWFERAANVGDPVAIRVVGLMRLVGLGVAQDTRAAAEVLGRSRRPTSNPMDDPASLLKNDGLDLPVTVAAKRWFEEDAHSGNRVAAYRLGMCLALGTDGSPDWKAAAGWLHVASPSVPMAALRYGQLLLAGKGVAIDNAEGRLFVTEAAHAGVVEAQLLLASLPTIEDR